MSECISMIASLTRPARELNPTFLNLRLLSDYYRLKMDFVNVRRIGNNSQLKYTLT